MRVPYQALLLPSLPPPHRALLRHAHLQHIFAGNVFVVFCADFRLKAERFTKTGSGHAQKKRKEKKRTEQKRKEKKRKEKKRGAMPRHAHLHLDLRVLDRETLLTLRA
jgi:hypothetical protein